MKIEIHNWEDTTKTIITHDNQGNRLHVANYNKEGVMSNETVYSRDAAKRNVGYVKYSMGGEIDYLFDRNHATGVASNSTVLYYKDAQLVYKKTYTMNEDGRPIKAVRYDARGQATAYETYEYSRDHWTVRCFDADGVQLEEPVTQHETGVDKTFNNES